MNKQIKLRNKYFCWPLEGDEKSRIRSRISQSKVRIRGSGIASGSAPKCHWSRTLQFPCMKLIYLSLQGQRKGMTGTWRIINDDFFFYHSFENLPRRGCVARNLKSRGTHALSKHNVYCSRIYLDFGSDDPFSKSFRRRLCFAASLKLRGCWLEGLFHTLYVQWTDQSSLMETNKSHAFKKGIWFLWKPKHLTNLNVCCSKSLAAWLPNGPG